MFEIVRPGVLILAMFEKVCHGDNLFSVSYKTRASKLISSSWFHNCDVLSLSMVYQQKENLKTNKCIYRCIYHYSDRLPCSCIIIVLKYLWHTRIALYPTVCHIVVESYTSMSNCVFNFLYVLENQRTNQKLHDDRYELRNQHTLED